jgi:pyruvate dehydrogenase E2 component (dihydrolipoamide acetyltransferase)
MDVKLPKLGEGAESGTVVSLLVKEGETIAKGQTILELENEKAVAPIPASSAGRVVKIRVQEGDKLSVGQVILTLEPAGAAPAEAPARPERTPRRAAALPPPPPEPEEPPTPEVSDEPAAEGAEPAEIAAAAEETAALPPASSPAIRKIARELGLDLRRVRGSERGGRIVMADLRAYVERLQRLAFTPKPAPARPAFAPAAPPAPAIDFSQWGPVAKQPLTPLRQVISRRMLECWTTIPHVHQFEEADVTGLLALRKKFAPAYEKQGARLTLTSFALKALAITLKKHPIFNASLDETAREMVLKQYYHLGVAVDTEAGLFVPVIRQVDQKSLLELSRDLTELAGKARERKLSPEDMKGGTFTLSNQGGIGGAHFTPIINKPEVAILGLGRGVTKPGIKGGMIEPRTYLPLCLAYDHRLIDGGSAARFIADLQQAFEGFREQDVKL